MSADVFVSVASYEDSDITNTVKSLLADPGLVLRVAVVLQDDDSERACALRGYGAEVVAVPASMARGPCWARSVAQTLYQGEPWFYQCDAHMRFVSQWAARLAEQSAMVPGRAVLTSLPQPIRNGDPNAACLMWPSSWTDAGFLSAGASYSLEHFNGSPLPARCLSAGHLWATGSWVQDVPYDPQLYYQGEEPTVAARSWTAGYDLYHPALPVFHEWDPPQPQSRHWERNPESWHDLDVASKERIEQLYAGEDLGVYGFGRRRSFFDWQEWSGFNYSKRTFSSDEEWTVKTREMK